MTQQHDTPDFSLHILIDAVAFAAHKHRAQTRKGLEASPYINHPVGLSRVLSHEGGVSDLTVLCAAILHDTVEDTDATEAEIAARFGPAVARVVMEVTDDKHLPKAARKQAQVDHAPFLSREARLVKLADKICNLRDIADAPPVGWDLARKREYFEWAKRVVDGLRGVHPTLEQVFDETYARGAELR